QTLRHGWTRRRRGELDRTLRRQHRPRRLRLDRQRLFGIIMRRVTSTPRPDWQKKVESVGLTWHSLEQPYWNESAFYEFTAKEVDVLETATNELEAMTLAAVQHVIDNLLYSRLGIPESGVPLIESSWQVEPSSLYGR